MGKAEVIRRYTEGVGAVPDDKYCKRLEEALGVSGICGSAADQHWREFKRNASVYAEKWFNNLVAALTRR